MLHRYLRAFFLALKLTFRGQGLPEVPQHPLVLWIEHLAALADDVYKVAEKNGVDKNARQASKLRLDGRSMSVETVLATIRFHAVQEYPMVLRGGLTQHVLNTIYASNVNDHYWVTRLAELEMPQYPTLMAAINRLKSHLSEFPLTVISTA